MKPANHPISGWVRPVGPATLARPWGAPCVTRAVCGLLLSLVLLAGSSVAAPRTRTASPTQADLEHLIATSPGPLTDLSPGDGETMPDPDPLPLLDQLGADLLCGSAIARAAAHVLPVLTGPRRDEAELLLVAPRLAAGRALSPPGDPFSIIADLSAVSRHAVSRRDADRDRIPDTMEDLQEELRFATLRTAALLGWSGPSGDPLRVILAATPFPEGRFVGGAAPFVVVPSRLPAGPARLGVLAHQLAHAAVRDLAPDIPAEFEEALAVWFATEVQSARREEADEAVVLPESVAAPHRALLSPGLTASRDDAGFIRFLGARPDAPAVALAEGWVSELLTGLARRLDAQRWAARDERRAAGVAATLPDIEPAPARLALAAALDELLAARGTSLAETVSAFHAGRLEDDLLARGSRVTVDAEIRGLPAEESRPAEEPGPFGQLRFGIDTPISGSLALGFEGDGRTEAIVFVLLDDGSVLRYPLDERRGATPLRFPGSRLQRVIVQVVSPLIPADGRSFEPATAALGLPDGAEGFRLRAAPDETHPFILSDITADVAVDHVTVDWTTQAESPDVLGWLVERALRPAGPFSALSPIPLPASARPQDAAGYAFIDSSVRAATRYHYRVVALTASGLTEPSPVVTVRTLPPTPVR